MSVIYQDNNGQMGANLCCQLRNRDHSLASTMCKHRLRLLIVLDMADGSDTTLTLEPPAQDLVSGIKGFMRDHGGATAVIEYVGRRGARIVLVGGDGTWGDRVAPSTDVARAACEQAGVTVENSWERELIELMRPSNDLWRSMSKRTLAR
jgi:hypothetical protein